MKPLDPLLSTLLSLSRTPMAAPTQRLENQVVSSWKQSLRPEQDFPSVYPIALACACGIFVLTLVSSFHLLAAPTNPSILLVNTALHEVLHP